MVIRSRGMSRAVAAVVLALTALLAATSLHPGSLSARAAWTGQGSLPGAGRIWNVAMNPAAPATVIAGTDGGVFVSRDGGQHWSQSTLAGKRVWAVGWDQRPPGSAFAGLDGGGVMRSDDGGGTWTSVSTGLPSTTVRSLAFGLSLIAAGTGNGVAVSTDGRTWEPVGLGGYDVSALAVSANLPTTTLVAGVDGAPAKAPGYLFRNVGPTSQWEALNVGTQTAVVSSIAASALPQAPAVRVLVACTSTGVYRSNDGGTVWQKTFPATSDLATSTLTTVAFSPVDPNLVYAADDGGGSAGGTLLRSTDGGLTFAAADSGLSADKEVTSLSVAPVTPPLVVAAINPPGRAGVVYAQTDASAPTPAATGAPEVGGPVPTIAPPPVVAATPAAPSAVATSGGGSNSRLHFLVDSPFKIAVELLTLLAAAYTYIRLRERRHIEGPP